MFLQYGTMTGTFCFMTGTNSLVLVNLTGRSPKIISRLAAEKELNPKIQGKIKKIIHFNDRCFHMIGCAAAVIYNFTDLLAN
jgi:hypothetical protein